MKRKKLKFMDVNEEEVLDREQMRNIMAGSGSDSTNWITCVYGSTVSEVCHSYDHSSPYQACRDVFGITPDNVSWGTNPACRAW